MTSIVAMINEYNNWGMNLRRGYELASGIRSTKRAVVVGMGGSGIVGYLARDISYHRKDVEILPYNTPDIPREEVRRRTLILISHSGNTREVIEAGLNLYRQAVKTIAITGGGRLRDISIDKGWELVEIPKSILPRLGLPQMLGALLKVLRAADKEEIHEAAETINEVVDNAVEQESRNIASWIFGKHPIIIYPTHAHSIAVRFSSMLGENSKILSTHIQYPELSHNFIEALSHIPPQYGIYMFYDSSIYSKALWRLLTYRDIPVFRRDLIHGDNKVLGYLSEVVIHDISTILLSEMRGINPMETPMIKEYKELIGNV